jgi:hypothetical protein
MTARLCVPGALKPVQGALGQRVRISYWIAPGRRIIMLTVFTTTRMRETAEIERAAAAMARCQREGHTPDEER